MNTRSRHLLVEYRGCAAETLDDLERVEALLVDAAEAARVTVVQTALHRFAPQGVSGVVIIEESHLSIHTWPEHGYAAVDFFTCGDGDPELAHDVLMRGLGAEQAQVMLVHRGDAAGMTQSTRVDGARSG